MNDVILKEQEIINRFLHSDLSKSPFSVTPYVRWHTRTSVSEFDILIRYKSINLAVVEIKQSLKDTNSLRLAKQIINDAFNILNCHFGIITDNTDFYLCNVDNKETYQKYTFESIVKTIINHKFVHTLRFEELSNALNNILQNNELEEFVGYFDEYDDHFYFKENKELEFWQQLLKSNHSGINTIYRYTSLETALLILKNNTYRMYGIVGMNDKSEIDYFDNYCNSTDKAQSYPILNNLFLSSCSLLKDNLTMWRLYGDDAKGVCLSFDINPNITDSFLLQSISYEDDQRINTKLNIIKDLLNVNVVFNDIDKWKHFFKANDYIIEQEVRLLFQDTGQSVLVKNKDWIKSKDNSIINPYVEFEIFNNTEFPLILKEIRLGPKCPEQETNKYQIQELIRQHKLSINVRLSEIKNYR